MNIPEGFLCVCRLGHVTAPGWMGQRIEPPLPTTGKGSPRLCPRASTTDGSRHVLCSETVVPLMLHPLLLAAHKLGGEEALQAVLADGYDAQWPAKPETIPWVVKISI